MFRSLARLFDGFCLFSLLVFFLFGLRIRGMRSRVSFIWFWSLLLGGFENCVLVFAANRVFFFVGVDEFWIFRLCL